MLCTQRTLLHALLQLPASMAVLCVGARGSILLERSADSQASSTDRAAPLNDVLEHLWQELDQCPRAELGCCTTDGAQIGCDGRSLTTARLQHVNLQLVQHSHRMSGSPCATFDLCRAGTTVERSGSFSGAGSPDDVFEGRIIVGSAASLPKVRLLLGPYRLA